MHKPLARYLLIAVPVSVLSFAGSAQARGHAHSDQRLKIEHESFSVSGGEATLSATVRTSGREVSLEVQRFMDCAHEHLVCTAGLAYQLAQVKAVGRVEVVTFRVTVALVANRWQRFDLRVTSPSGQTQKAAHEVPATKARARVFEATPGAPTIQGPSISTAKGKATAYVTVHPDGLPTDFLYGVSERAGCASRSSSRTVCPLLLLSGVWRAKGTIAGDVSAFSLGLPISSKELVGIRASNSAGRVTHAARSHG